MTEAAIRNTVTHQPGPAVVSLEGVSKIYGDTVRVKAVNQLSLRVDAGELVAIMGPSGSGKSTVLNLVAGILPATSGTVRVGGQNPADLSEEEAAVFRRKRLGFVFQDFNLVDTLTIQENIMLPLMLAADESPARMRRRSRAVAEQLGIGDVLAHRVHEVSGGQAQRAAIGRAIIHEPQLLLADEPTGNLDSAAAQDVMRIFSDLNKRQGVSTIVVTHDARTASWCKRVVFIKDGAVHSELYREDDRLAFYDEILNVLKLIGGEGR
ncbi:ABC transporter ATP-binding protein [Actinomyces qiguomingii]|uniref:ABC transporter ATP-binding protein n=1 Tax=Actinomyces qiguomingii TaxID=2057800 RepID=UPI000CA0481F|nr:ABC transporter ATP-binding protein [Actinomyces qiguomingii]